MRFFRCALVLLSPVPWMGHLCQSQTASAPQFITAKVLKFPNNPPGAFVVGDVNGDGKLDVVALTSSSPSGLEVLIGHGNGTFTPRPIDQTSAFAYGGIALADINGDGHLDIVRASPGQTDQDGNIVSYGALGVLLGNGDGSFQAEHNFLPPNTFLTGGTPVVGDVNGDGRPDVAVYAPGGVQVYFNRGGGRLVPGPVYKGSSSPAVYSLLGGADLNGDGKLDVVANTSTGIQIFASNGSGGLSAGALYNFGTAKFITEVLAIGDLNRDGQRDLVVGNPQNLAVLLGRGDGTFRVGKPIPYNLFRTSGDAPLQHISGCGLAIADFRKDGKPDLVSCGSVYPGHGDGTFGYPRIYSVDIQSEIVAADFNSDHQLDLLSPGAGGLILSLGVKGGSFSSSVISDTVLAESIATADFNRDGIADVAVVNAAPDLGGQTGHVTVFAGTGKNYFAPPRTYPIGLYGGQIVAGDVNGDGIQDLVVIADSSAGPNFTDTSVLLGNPDGSFKPARNYTLVITPQYGYTHISDAYLADVNNDSKPDLIGDWGVALGNGDGTFRKPIPLPPVVYANSLNALTVGDFNHDGRLDLAVAEGQSSGASILLFAGDGTGSFKLQSEQDSIGYSASSIRAADINKDGNLDVILTNTVRSSNGLDTQVISVALGKGNGTFETVVNTAGFGNPAVPGSPNNVLVADFDGDGRLDVVTNSGYFDPPDTLSLAYGLGNGSFTSPVHYFTSNLTGSLGTGFPGRIYYPSTGAVLDVNGDGYPDIVTLDTAGLVRIINSRNYR